MHFQIKCKYNLRYRTKFLPCYLYICLLVSPGSSSENVKKPLLISSVLGANNLDVAVCNLGDCAGGSTKFPINFAVTDNGLVSAIGGVFFCGCSFGEFTLILLLVLLLLLLSTTAGDGLSTLTADCN